MRELRNNVSQILRRVEAGESMRVTVSGRPVAVLAPIQERPRSMPWETFMAGIDRARPDAALATELRELLPDRTDDLPL